MLVVFSESYGILEWENTFGFVSGSKSTLLNSSTVKYTKKILKNTKVKMRNQDISVFGLMQDLFFFLYLLKLMLPLFLGYYESMKFLGISNKL